MKVCEKINKLSREYINVNLDEKTKLDYTIQDPQQRKKIVQEIINSLPSEKLTNKYLQVLSNYLIFAMDKQERKTRMINTSNRMVTVNKRETSFEGIVSKLENGEDGIYNMISDNKNILLVPKISITDDDIQTIPGMKSLREQIKKVEQREKEARGRRKYLLRKQLIEMRQDQYVLKLAYKPVVNCVNGLKSSFSLNLEDKITVIDDKVTYLGAKNTIVDNGQIIDESLISFFNPNHLSILLCNYSRLKESCWDRLNSDIYYVMQDLDNLIEKTLRDEYPVYYDLLIYKIDGMQNVDIQQELNKKYGVNHTVEYLSQLWRNKIPKLLADQAEKDYLEWYYSTRVYGKWKRCSCCGQIKVANHIFFSKNKTSKDGFYSICKECRAKKYKSKGK